MTPRKRANLRGKKANVAIHRNGVSIEIADVSATDAGLVAADLLDAMRGLTKAYPELIVDAGTVGAGAGIEVPEETEDAEAHQPTARIGFTAT